VMAARLGIAHEFIDIDNPASVPDLQLVVL
jgi:hypothetical protein